MKKLIFIFIFAFIFSDLALAEPGDLAGATLISFGLVKGLQSVGIDSLEHMELEEWKDERALSTAVLGDICGFYYEARVLGDNRINYLWLTLKNNNPGQMSFNPIEAEFRFSNGIERRPDLFRFNQIFFEPGRLYNMLLPFPAKEDFKDQKSLSVSIPFKDGGKTCEIPIRLVRNPKIPDTTRSTVSLDIVETEVYYGVSQISGNLSKVIDSKSTSGGINLIVYGPRNGGMYIGFKAFGKGRYSDAISRQENYALGGKADLGILYVGYTQRFTLNKDDIGYYRIGFGSATLGIYGDSDSAIDRFSSSSIDLQGGFQKFFAHVKSGIWTGSYYVSLNLSDSYVLGFDGMKAGSKFDGNTLSASLILGLGY